jgi:signal transduction histidine kinase
MERAAAVWRRLASPAVRDAILAVVVTVLLLLGSYGEGHPGNPSNRAQFRNHVVPNPGPALLLVAVACLVLAWRRRAPVTVLIVSTAAVSAYSLLGFVNGAVLIAPIIALYTVATEVSVRRAIVAAVLTLGVLLTVTAANNPFGHISGGGFDIIPFMVVAALFAGIAVANRRAYAASLQDRAEQDARRRLDEERLRIARELHDVVAHTMATINVQAGVAAHVLSTRPEAAAESLQAIKTASKEGLRELRAILNVLRQADDADPTQPAPGTAQLAALIDGARRAGLETTFSVTGEPVPLPAAVDLAAYRIVQESLTNTIRHAGPATAAVSLGYRHDELRVEVTDTGRGPATAASRSTAASRGATVSRGAAASQGAAVSQGAGQATAAGQDSGHGLAGMRERAASVGGTVETGPGPAGGFRVAARLPLRGRLADPPDRTSDTADATPREGARP